MVKKCPPGVICIENVTFLAALFILLAIGTYYHCSLGQSSPVVAPTYRPQVCPQSVRTEPLLVQTPPSVLLNPYVPPLQVDPWFPRYVRGGVPINIETRGSGVGYTQVGLLTRLRGRETILPLMGRPLYSNRSKWQFYTLSDQNNSIKLPVSKNGRSCTGQYGCDQLYDADTVYVEGYKDAFKATIYENQTPSYIPYI